MTDHAEALARIASNIDAIEMRRKERRARFLRDCDAMIAAIDTALSYKPTMPAGSFTVTEGDRVTGYYGNEPSAVSAARDWARRGATETVQVWPPHVAGEQDRPILVIEVLADEVEE